MAVYVKSKPDVENARGRTVTWYQILHRQQVNYDLSLHQAEKRGARLLGPVDMPAFLRRHATEFEATWHFNRFGRAMFYISDDFIVPPGYYKINPEGKTFEGMFERVDGKDIHNMPFQNRVFVGEKGPYHQLVNVIASGFDGCRIGIYTDVIPRFPIPIVVTAKEMSPTAAFHHALRSDERIKALPVYDDQQENTIYPPVISNKGRPNETKKRHHEPT
ncbi:MAG: hypothetical protein KGH64_02320 [Candidatus Micrarchaeota archaeon]|nr:hypothetical protein [Candidatus Micrarchaeota archaeon]MDE1834151.1 hypothetical protein [Candidatus Micrarchaeota archaeon]MDE1859819.1 hypothetical protein [Candidatus Micrarchaeota archaeon]